LKETVEVIDGAGVEPIHVDSGVLWGHLHAKVRSTIAEWEMNGVGCRSPPRERRVDRIVEVSAHEDHVVRVGRIATRAVFGSPPRLLPTVRLRPFLVFSFLVFLLLALIRPTFVVVRSSSRTAAWLRLSGLRLTVTASL